MPIYEYQSVNVTLTIEVDGHTLSFTESNEAKGARYHGADPRDSGYGTADTLESSIRAIVAVVTAELSKQANTAIARLYPTCGPTGSPLWRP